MKKIILSTAGLMMVAAASHAQIIKQVGAQQFADQVMNGNNQKSTITQVQAEGNTSRTNYGNYAITFQGIPTNTGANTAVIDQNDGSQGNRAGITQGSDNNKATIQQNGGAAGLSGGAASTSATITAVGGDGNLAGILQIGSNNTATLSQNNNSRQNGAEIYQNGLTGVGTGNTAVLVQSNNSINNDAFIFQGFSDQNVQAPAVTNNQAYIYQGRVDANDAPGDVQAVDNIGRIVQVTSNNVARIYQGATVDGTAGNASGSWATVTQRGDGTTANVYQGTGYGKSVNGRVTITQAGSGQTDNVYQGYGFTGSDLSSKADITSARIATTKSVNTIYQGYYGVTQENQATITQEDLNTATITQGGGPGSYSSNDIATITQRGKGNDARVMQNSTTAAIYGGNFEGVLGTGVGKDNTAEITQGVDAKTSQAGIYQGAAASGENLRVNKSTATVSQVTGTGLKAFIFQAGSVTADMLSMDGYTPPAAFDGLASSNLTSVALGETSTSNSASINQGGGNKHGAKIFQGGTTNSAKITQNGGNESQSVIVQAEKTVNNQAIINQSSSGNRNVAAIYQFANANAQGAGKGNTAIIDQVSGMDNVAVAQQGLAGAASPSDNNFIQITQNGNSNQARVAQIGTGNYMDITQNGNGNKLVNSDGTTGTFAIQQGNNNRLVLTQTAGAGDAAGYTYKYTQVGNNNTQVITQPTGN